MIHHQINIITLHQYLTNNNHTDLIPKSGEHSKLYNLYKLYKLYRLYNLYKIAKNKSLPTFQIEDSVWNQFRMKAGSKGKSASSVLVELVNIYINSNPYQIDNTGTNYITYIINKIDELRNELLTVIEELKLDRANIRDNNYITYISNAQTDMPLVK